MSNVSFKYNNVVSIKEFGKYNNDGDYIVNTKNQYLIDLLKRALQLTCGTSFDFSKEYKCDFVTYNAIEECEVTFIDKNGNNKTVFTRERQADKPNNTIGDNPILNAITLANVLLEDRQLVYFNNKLNQPTIKIISSKHKDDTFYVKDKNSNDNGFGLNPVDDTTISVTKKKGYRKVTDDDKKAIFEIFELVNLTRYLKPLAIIHKKDKKEQSA